MMKSVQKKLTAMTIIIASVLLTACSEQQQGGTGLFEGYNDVGNPKLQGSFSYNPSTDVYTLTGGGYNMWGRNDEFFMAWKVVRGDFNISAKVDFEGEGVNAHRKMGVIVRETLTGESRYADIAVHGDGLVSLQYRDATGGMTQETVADSQGADHITLERRDRKLIMKVGKGGFSDTPAGEIELNLPAFCYVGIFVCSHENDVTEKARFSDVQLQTFPQQAQRVISYLETLDITTGERTVVKEFPYLIEAPNWTPDGKWLVYNSEGRIFKIEPENPGEPRIINTGFATRCNNDHIISFDGQWLIISNTPAEGGGSKIYTLPFTGGTPQLITSAGPSYLHGVSPDNKYLAYCADRRGNYDVYIVPFEGGPEIRLTTAEGLDDGPEYSPCGRYIWFNSVRTGLMQVWQMNADGTSQRQMTFDETRNSWFPHVSPDGEQVVFITYHVDDVAPGDHPANKNVDLRLMPATGGTPVVIAELFGGQGTINVHSWAPDSKRFAFVSYRLVE
jgi:dipeptidyl aminopeptidase/acylaminoacyl peptidase